MSERESPRFLFTSGVKSPHHAHLGYGLKRGLEGAPRALILTLESACVELVASRREMSGALIALDQRGEERWRCEVMITAGHDHAGRPNFAVRGVCPDEGAPDDARAWRWWPDEVTSADGVNADEVNVDRVASDEINSDTWVELVTPPELSDYLERNRGRDPDALTQRNGSRSALGQRSRAPRALIVMVAIVMILAYAHQLGRERTGQPARGLEHLGSSSTDAPATLEAERPLDRGAPALNTRPTGVQRLRELGHASPDDLPRDSAHNSTHNSTHDSAYKPARESSRDLID